MYSVKDTKYMVYVIGKYGIADFTLTDDNDFHVFEENDYMFYDGTMAEYFGEIDII